MLSARKQAFAVNIAVKRMSATSAYIAAGYAESGAHNNASRLIRTDTVSQEIQKLRDSLQTESTMDATEWLETVSEGARLPWTHEMKRICLDWIGESTGQIKVKKAAVEVNVTQQNLYADMSVDELAELARGAE